MGVSLKQRGRQRGCSQGNVGLGLPAGEYKVTFTYRAVNERQRGAGLTFVRDKQASGWGNH